MTNLKRILIVSNTWLDVLLFEPPLPPSPPSNIPKFKCSQQQQHKMLKWFDYDISMRDLELA